MAQAVRGFHLLSVYSGGFSVICLICHFNAPVRRFNSGCYPYILPPFCMRCTPCLWPCGVALHPPPCIAALRCAASLPPACAALVPLAGWLAPPCWPWLLVGACLSAKVAIIVAGKVAKVAGIVVSLCAKVSGKVAVKVASACAKVAHLPQNHSRLQNSVYKGGVFLALFPRVNGKPLKSRAVLAYFASKSLASMYLRWSCSGVNPSICG